MTVWRWLLRGSGKQLCGTCFVFLREECEHQLSVFGLISLALRSDRKLWYGTEDGISNLITVELQGPTEGRGGEFLSSES